MDALKLLLIVLSFQLSGCYTLKSAYHQMHLLTSAESYEEVLKKKEITEEQRRKLYLAQEVLVFAEKELKLHSDGNYSKVTWLDRPYVTWVVSAAERWSLKSYEWKFPIVGKVPYLGFFKESEALEKEKTLQKEGYDTYMRGVSAYSTLGWFQDPLLSSMLRYEDQDLVETLIHELVHTTFWVKNHVDFNERLASFLGQKGALQFYQHKEGKNSSTSQLILNEASDEFLFSQFITQEVKDLEKWYSNLNPNDRNEESREKRIEEIQNRFVKNLKPTLKTQRWSKFPEWKLNNARLTLFRTYLNDFSEFERVWRLSGENFSQFFEKIQPLKEAKDPDQKLAELL